VGRGTHGNGVPTPFHVSRFTLSLSCFKTAIFFWCLPTPFVSTTSPGVGVSLRAHPVRGELHIQRHANRPKGYWNNTKWLFMAQCQTDVKIINTEHRHERM